MLGFVVLVKYVFDPFQNMQPDSVGKECLPSLHVIAKRCFLDQPEPNQRCVIEAMYVAWRQ